MIQIEAVIARTIGDPSTSDWLKKALADAMWRDPLNALRDAEMLVDMLGARLNAVFDEEK